MRVGRGVRCAVMVSALSGLRGCISLGSLFTRMIGFVGRASLAGLRANGRPVLNSSLFIGVTMTRKGARRRTAVRTRHRVVSVRVPVGARRACKCSPIGSLPRIRCSRTGSYALCPNIGTRALMAYGPNRFIVFFPRSNRRPYVNGNSVRGTVFGVGTWGPWSGDEAVWGRSV